MLEIKRLRLLWELQKRGTVAAVAEAMSYTPSAVSQQLSQLENEAGVPLLRKAGRQLELTPAAYALVQETDGLLAGLERAEAALHRNHAEIAGTVKVAVFQTAMLALMPQALQNLREQYPELRVEMVQYEPKTALRETWARSFDLVVAEQYPHHSTAHYEGLERQVITHDPLQLALPPEGAAGGRFESVHSLHDVAHMPWVVEQPGAASRHWAVQLCRTAGFEPDIRYETPDLQAHVRLVESGNAVAFLPGLVHGGMESKVRRLDLAGAPRRTIFTAVRSSMGAHPALTAVREEIARQASLLGTPTAMNEASI